MPFLQVFSQNSKVDDFRFLEVTATELKEGYQTNKFNVKDVVKAYLERIDKLDKNGIQLNSVIAVNPDAMKIADSLDHLKNKNLPLFGIPILIKDNIDTNNMPTTAGSLLLKNSIPKDDAFLIKKINLVKTD